MKKFASIAAAALAALLHANVASAADNYPNKPVRVVVPFAAGGPTDIVTRKVTELLSARLGQPVIVDNRPGGSTLIGTEAVLNAPADGYTVLVTNTQLVQLPALMPKISYVVERDFLPVAQLCGVPLMLTTHSKLPVKDFQSLIKYIKDNPNKTNYASTGYGGTANIYGEEFRRLYSLEAEHIPYKGEAPVIPDFISNRVNWFFATPSQVMPHITQGTLRPLAVTGSDRLAKLPDVPTMKELGAESFVTVGWFGMFLPAKAPRAIAERLSKEVLTVMQDPDLRKFLEDNMFVPKGVGIEEFAPEISRISATWSRMIKENNIRIQ